MIPAQRYILSIDQGTTGSTALIFNSEGRIKGRAYAEIPQYYPQPGWVEHDATEIWSITHRVIEEALAHAGVAAHEIHAIGITNQRETTLLWDRNSGNPVHRAIVWQDRRTAAFCDDLKSERLEELWQKKTGLLIDPYFSATKIHFLLHHQEGLKDKALQGDVAFGTMDSWLVWKLTGGACHVTDYSNASRTLLYNIHDLVWDEDILKRLDIPPVILPEVQPSSHVYAETSPDAFFGERVPIAGIAGDQQAALFGQACYEKGLAKNTYGTGSFVLMNTGKNFVTSKERLLTTIAWKIGEDPVEYALEGSIFVTGAAVQWLRDGLNIIEHASETEALARSLKDNEGVYIVPALTGLGAPHWDPKARGAAFGLTRGTHRKHIVRAILESIAYQTRDVVEAIQRGSGIALKELRADGGAVANTFLMQFQSDILNVPIEVPVIAETTALGAAYLAGLATGFWKSRQDIDAKWQCAQRYEPKMESTQREALYACWQQAVQSARSFKCDIICQNQSH